MYKDKLHGSIANCINVSIFQTIVQWFCFSAWDQDWVQVNHQSKLSKETPEATIWQRHSLSCH
jgi:hypothetical protein